MKIALIIIGVLVAIVVVVVLVGYSLPVKHRAARERTFASSPEVVYATITNVEKFPEWRSKVKSVEVVSLPGGTRSFREKGGDGEILYVIDEAQPPTRLVTRIADKTLPFGGTWTYELAPAAAGTTLRITEDGEVYNPVFRFMSRFVFGQTATIDGYLDDLRKKLSSS